LRLAEDEVSAKVAARDAAEAEHLVMTKSIKPDGGPVPKWMRLLVEKWRVADQAEAYPHADPPQPEKPDADAAPDDHAPPRDAPPSSSSEN
jgi:hypothetical protein